MKNKGFTLIELLAIIVILAIVMLIGNAGIKGVTKSINQNSLDTKVNLILSAAQLWGEDNKNTVKTSPNSCYAYYNNEATPKDNCIIKTVEELIKAGYYKSESDDLKVTNNVTGSSMLSVKISIYYENSRIYARINEDCQVTDDCS